MKPRHGLFIVLVGWVIALLSVVPICLVLFAADAPPAVEDEWRMGTVLLYFGFVWLVFGHVVMAIGAIMTGVGVFTKQPAKRF